MDFPSNYISPRNPGRSSSQVHPQYFLYEQSSLSEIHLDSFDAGEFVLYTPKSKGVSVDEGVAKQVSHARNLRNSPQNSNNPSNFTRDAGNRHNTSFQGAARKIIVLRKVVQPQFAPSTRITNVNGKFIQIRPSQLNSNPSSLNPG